MATVPLAPANPWASRQRWFVAALLLLFVVLSAKYTIKVFDGNRSAIMRWREQLLALEGGEDIYETHIYPNPPIMAMLLTPFAKMPPLVGALVWYYLKVGMALASFYFLFRLVQGAGVEFPPWAKALVVVLSLRPILSDLDHGNVNLFILFLVMAGLYAIHKGWPTGGGMLIALAFACKVTPLLFVPYLVWKRAWRALAGCVLGAVLFLGVVPSFYYGWQENRQLLTSWYEKMVEPFVVGGEVTSVHENQSLPGLSVRLLTHSPSWVVFNDPESKPETRYDNLFDLDPRVPRWIVKSCMLLFAALVVLRCRTPLKPQAGWRLSAEFALIVLGMLLFSERTWKHHCVTLMLPFGVLCYYLATYRPPLWLRNYLIASLVAVTLLVAMTLSGLDDNRTATHLYGSLCKQAEVYGVYVWSHMILMAALFVLLGRKDPEAYPNSPG
jgi:alpha-1,2-mannosyltransferase